MKAPVNSRYAHCDGVTDIAVYEASEEGKLLTCGSDGDIRLWENPEDQDPLVFSASDSCLAISCHKNVVFVGTENNCVESFSLPTGKAQGVVVKFKAAVNHLDISKKGNILIAGSGDMTFQIIKLNEDGSASSAPRITVDGHSAPVLSVLVDPLEEFVVSTGCDGSIIIWTLAGKQVKSWERVFASSNDIMTSKTLCRPSWSFNGEFLAVPLNDRVILYNRKDWEQVKSLNSSKAKILSVTKFSFCGKFLAAGSTDGTLIIWDSESGKLLYENVDTKDHITGLTFSKSGKNIFAMDIKGRMIFVNDFNAAHDTQDINIDDELEPENDTFIAKGVVAEPDDPFDDDLDGMFMEDDDPEASEISISKIKAMSGWLSSDKEDVFVGIEKAKKVAGLITTSSSIKDDDDSKDGMNEWVEKERRENNKARQPIVMPFTNPQKPFQPSSSPENLEHRFMVWNSIGIIRNYAMEEDDDSIEAIDIEFHDVSFHTGIHYRNKDEYKISTLSKEAAVFASPKQKEFGSKLMCLHYSSWDNNNKEWIVDLPKGEEITGLAIGTGWLTAATDSNRLRIFSIGGLQRNVFEVGGQIIAISGYEDLLFIAFHNGIGLHGNQSVAYSILRIRSGTGVFPLISNDPLPLSPKSTLTWMGFSDEGCPAFSDSTESFRILSGRMWTTYLNMKDNLIGDSHHFWVTGASLCNQHVRAIKCKGTNFPPTLPRPTITLLSAKIPLCAMETEKGQLEDTLLRSLMLSALTKKMDKKGFDIEDYKEQAEKDIKETLMKLFAMCCKGERDYRASEYVSMMPSTHSIQVAIKYANKLRKMALTDRLTTIGRKKLDEEEEGIEEDDDDFESIRVGNVIYSSMYSSFGNNSMSCPSSHNNMQASSNSINFSSNQSSCDLGILEENPLLSRQRAEIRTILSTSVYKNPFKKDIDCSSKPNSKLAEVSSSRTDTDDGRGIALIDAWKKPIDKPSIEFNPKHPKSKTAKKAAEKDKHDKNNKNVTKTNKTTHKQATLALFQINGKKSKQESVSPAEIHIDESSSNSDLVDNVTANENSPTDLSEKFEKNIPSEEKQKCLQKSHTVVNVPETEKKRKRIDDESECSRVDDSEKKSRISSKLAAFAINRNEDLSN